MPDVFAVCDRIVVLRRGRKVADKAIADSSPEEVTGLITGAIQRRLRTRAMRMTTRPLQHSVAIEDVTGLKERTLLQRLLVEPAVLGDGRADRDLRS